MKLASQLELEIQKCRMNGRARLFFLFYFVSCEVSSREVYVVEERLYRVFTCVYYAASLSPTNPIVFNEHLISWYNCSSLDDDAVVICCSRFKRLF